MPFPVLKRFWEFLAVLISLLLLSHLGFGESMAVPGEILVQFKGAVSAGEMMQAGRRLGMSGQPLRSLQSGLITQQGLSSTGRIQTLQIERVKVPEGMSLEEAIRKLADSSLVRYCGPNYLRKPIALPNDPLYQQGYQWWLTAIGADQVVAKNLLPVGAPVVIAILDTGVSLVHEDLAGRLVPGIDFFTSGGDGDVPHSEFSMHGTHVAGIAAASTNNNLGIAGTASAANIRIMPVRVMNEDGGSDFVISQGMLWAVEHGARVLNLSLGGPEENPIVHAVIQYAYDHSCVVVASAGNLALEQGGTPPVPNPIVYPAAYPHVIAVAACDIAGYRAPYSSYHDYVDVAAPGGYYISVTTTIILSTVPSFHFEDQPTIHYRYYPLQGTSMAAPMVAGTAAMLLAQNPGLTPDKIEAIITATADKTGSLAASGQDRDIELGYGRLNLYKALQDFTYVPLTEDPKSV